MTQGNLSNVQFMLDAWDAVHPVPAAPIDSTEQTFGGIPVQVDADWNSIRESMPAAPKRSKNSTWTPEEDAIVTGWVIETGRAAEWSGCALRLPGRTGKNCRERWHNHLNPNVNKAPFTATEDEIIVEAQAKYGNQWATISQALCIHLHPLHMQHWMRAPPFPPDPGLLSAAPARKNRQRHQKSLELNPDAKVPQGWLQA